MAVNLQNNIKKIITDKTFYSLSNEKSLAFQKTVHPKIKSQWGPKQHCKLFIYLVIYSFSNNLFLGELC